MLSPYERERIENWIGDYCHGDAAREFESNVRAAAPEVLGRFLTAACERAGELDALAETHVRAALLEDVARIEIPPEARAEVPNLCASLLAELEREGRLAGGRALASYLRALRGAWRESTGPSKPYERPGAAISRNDPCPCGSGRKYKKCCLHLLG
jgi:hypothetical protein